MRTYKQKMKEEELSLDLKWSYKMGDYKTEARFQDNQQE